jgi:hypothetical protein
MRLTVRASSKEDALHAVARLNAEVYEADISIRGRLNFVHVTHGGDVEAEVLRRVHAYDLGAREIAW